MGISRNLSVLAPGASTSGVLAITKGGTGLATVGTNGQVLTSNGTTAVWAAATAGNYSNANVQAYLPTYNGNVGGSIQTGSFGVGTSSSGTTGEIRATNNITSWYSSDERLKENFNLIDNPLDRARGIRGYFFDWSEQYIIDHGGQDGLFVRKHDVGVKAQEIQAVLPEAVAERPDGYLGVRYELLVPLLFECVNELSARLEKLEKGE